VYFSVFVFILYLSGWYILDCVVYFIVFVFVLYLWIVHSGVCCVLRCVCLRSISLDCVLCTSVCLSSFYISLDCTFWILGCVLQCVCFRSISLDCTF
jgi:hypothetical protein